MGLLNEDVAHRLDISPTKSFFIFLTWIKSLSKLLKNLLVWLPREAIQDNLPGAFIKLGIKQLLKLGIIIDFGEGFIDRPKLLDCQAATCSDYKRHKTIKILVGISPSGFITFLSLCYGGRASDNLITKDNGFYDLLERDHVVEADRGFQIQEDLLLRSCNLQVPSGARTKSQMTKKEVQKTRETTNLRIHVERAINRIKNYRILKGTLPITMMQHVDEIVVVCPALCNIKNVLIQTKKD